MEATKEMKDAFYRFYLENEINILTNQLQAYKDKEDKIRELFEKKPRYDKEKHQHILRVGTMEELLEILNEGDKE